MRCAQSRELLGPYLDAELMADEAAEVREHLAQCPDCSRALDALTATSHSLREGLRHYAAPDVLKARIRSALANAEAADSRRGMVRTPWLRLAAAGLLIASAASLATYGIVRRGSTDGDVRYAVLTSHVRSLMPGHLTDVISNNTHNVKPWFNGRVDLSPPVPNLDSAGFVLTGGRLDYLAGRTVAVVVYARRQHIINVVSWPEPGNNRNVSAITTQGYHLVDWRTAGVTFWAVSDLNVGELTDFVTRFQRAAADVHP
jgi:anti-sigma factor RsiW